MQTPTAGPVTAADIMKTLAANDLTIKITVQPSDCDAYTDLADCMTQRQIKNMMVRADANVWEWCDIKVKASWNGVTAVTYLGACSYKSEADFIKCADYYEDMVAEVLADIQEQAEAIACALA